MTTRKVGLRLVAVTGVFACCGIAHAQPPGAAATPSGLRASALPANADDMAMPDDLGAPLAGASPPQLETSGARALTVNSSIDQIASNPRGKAALERAMPGLCERAEYPMFKSLSLKRLAGLSSGRITEATLDSVQSDLTRIGPADGSTMPSHGTFYPLTHTASSSIHYSSKQIGRFSRSLYHRVVLVVASL